MKDVLISLLETFGYPVRLQGSLAPEEAYPESFFTFWNADSEDACHYDNRVRAWVWDFTIYFYSTSPALVNTVLDDARQLLSATGWVMSGRGYDVASDEPTHTGRAIDVMYRQRSDEVEDEFGDADKTRW